MMSGSLSRPLNEGFSAQYSTPAYGLTLIVGPTEEPVSVSEAKVHSRIILDDEDALIESQLRAARMHVENLTGLQLCTAAWRWSGVYYPCTLPRPPLQTVSSVKYIETDGTWTTVAASNYQIDNLCRPARIESAYGTFWPSPRSQSSASVLIDFISGFGGPEDVPANIKHAILLLFASMYENREPAKSEMMAVEALLSPESVLELV